MCVKSGFGRWHLHSTEKHDWLSFWLKLIVPRAQSTTNYTICWAQIRQSIETCDWWRLGGLCPLGNKTVCQLVESLGKLTNLDQFTDAKTKYIPPAITMRQQCYPPTHCAGLHLVNEGPDHYGACCAGRARGGHNYFPWQQLDGRSQPWLKHNLANKLQTDPPTEVSTDRVNAALFNSHCGSVCVCVYC